MPHTLKIETGSLATRVIPIEEGKPLRIGRTEQAGCAITDDRFLSKVHFEIYYDGRTSLIRDLQSANGTLRNGSRIVESLLEDGDEIIAGQTRFRFCVDRPLPAVPEAERRRAIDYTRLLAALREQSLPLYAVLDAAQEPGIFQILLESRAEYASLFEAEAMGQLAHFAPYVVPLAPISPLLGNLIEQGWGKNWGIYLTSNSPLPELIAFLRRALICQLPDGGQALLRFYDPRVLRSLLPSLTISQRRFFFGLVRFYMMESQESDVALGFSLGEGGINKIEFPFVSTAAPRTTVISHALSLIPERASTGHADEVLTLGDGQIKILESVKGNSFEDAMVNDLRMLYPDRFKAHGEAQMINLVHKGCTRPQRYGIRSQPELRRYVELMLQLGPDFDTDASLPWAAKLLAMRMAPAEKLRMLETRQRDLSACRAGSPDGPR